MDWLVFIAFLILLAIVLGGFVLWLRAGRGKNPKQKKRRLRHHRSRNPTLAQTGGLPQKRDPNTPPPAP
jgi:hypothetical protein